MVPHPSRFDTDHSYPIDVTRLPWYARLLLFAGGAVLVGLLITAATLTPNSKGYGTHEKLGLAPCLYVQLSGRRCPSCGMTTSWSHIARGQVIQSFRANSGGALLAIVAAMAGPWMLLSGLRGRWVVSPPNHSIVLITLVTVLGVTLIDWVIRMTL